MGWGLVVRLVTTLAKGLAFGLAALLEGSLAVGFICCVYCNTTLCMCCSVSLK